MKKSRRLLALPLLFVPVFLDDFFSIKTYNLFFSLLILCILWMSVLKLRQHGFLGTAFLLLFVAGGMFAALRLVFLTPALPIAPNPALSIFFGFLLFYVVMPAVGFLIEVLILRPFEKRKSDKLKQMEERTQETITRNRMEMKALFESLGKSPRLPHS